MAKFHKQIDLLLHKALQITAQNIHILPQKIFI